MIVLAIDTSCDETAAAVLDDDSPRGEAGRVLSSVVWSQLKLHAHWGGVVPSIARRAHEERLPAVVTAALRRAHLSNLSNLANSVTAIAVTIGPGLAPALEVGVAFAKKLALQYYKPLIPVSHLEGHIASLFLRRKSGAFYVKGFDALEFPVLNLIVSGGHTELVETTRISNVEFRMSNERKTNPIQNSSFVIRHFLLGQTLDDAAGECLDKVGRALGLGYPAGPVVEKLASESALKSPTFEKQRSDLFRLPIPMERSRRDDLNFSFSGLKTAAVRKLDQAGDWSSSEIADFCASFQEAVISALLLKVRRAVVMTGIKTVFLSGGVAANNKLRRRLRQTMKTFGGRAFCAPKRFTGDNAAMIGLAAQWAMARGEIARSEIEIGNIDRKPNLNFQVQ